METIGDRLQKLRTGKGLTVSEMAEIIGVSRISVGNWERGDKQPRINNLKAYANYFNVPIDWIRYGNEDEILTVRNKLCQLEKTMDFILDYLTTLDRRQDIIINEIKEIKEALNSANTEEFKE